MGCCVSTNDKGSSASASQKQSRVTLPPSMEEETVKEVLSETPTPKPPVHHFPSKLQPQIPKPQKLPVFDRVLDPLGHGQKAEKGMMKANDTLGRIEELKPKAAEEISEELWEICSLSESPSISTATNLTEDSGFRHQGHRGAQRSPAKIQPSRAGSFSGDMEARRDRTALSPARRSEQSLRRMNPVPVRPAPGGEPGRSRSEPRRRERDPMESSVRRSRSPSMTRVENPGPGGARSDVGRSPSARTTNPSPSRVRSGQNERRVRDPDGNNRGEGGLLGSGNEQPDGDKPLDLENPLVSLECFIFL